MSAHLSRAEGRLALAGLGLGLAAASNVIAWRLGYPSRLGDPLLGHVYAPWDAIRWAQIGWASGSHRNPFVGGLTASVAAGLSPLALVRWRAMNGALRPEETLPGSRLAASPDLMAVRGFSLRPPGVVVGLHRGRPIFCSLDVHALVLGATRSGKGVNTLVSTGLTFPGSMVVSDFKRELGPILGPMREHLGRVVTIDPTDPASGGFNPLLAIRTGPTLVTDAQSLAAMLARSDVAEGKDRIWSDATALVVTALLISARLSPAPTLGTFYGLVRDFIAKRPIEARHDYVREVLHGVETRWHENQRSSVIFNLEVKLAFLASPIVQAILARDDFRADDLAAADRPLTVFLGTPLSETEAMQPFHRLLLSALFRPLTTDLKVTLDGRDKLRRVMFLCDEFTAFGHMPEFSKLAANLLGYGIQLVLGVQDEVSIKQTYGEYNMIASNCRLRLFSAAFSRVSLENELGMIGREVTVRHSQSRQRGWFGRVSVTEAEVREALVEASELMGIADTHNVVYAPGLARPAKIEKLHYYKHPYFRGLFGEPDGPRPGLCGDPAAVDALARPAPVQPSVLLDEGLRGAIEMVLQDGERVDDFVRRAAAHLANAKMRKMVRDAEEAPEGEAGAPPAPASGAPGPARSRSARTPRRR